HRTAPKGQISPEPLRQRDRVTEALWSALSRPARDRGGAVEPYPRLWSLGMSDTPSLNDLDAAAPFARRHIGPTPHEQQAMLDALGYASLSELMAAAVPANIHTVSPLRLPAPLSEPEAIRRLRAMAGRNNPGVAMIGLGYHPTATP